MSISVETNQNVFFFKLLYALLNKPDKMLHPLAEKALKEFQDVVGLKQIGRFVEGVRDKKIPAHPYYLMFLSVHLSNDLKPLPLAPKDGFGPNSLKGYEDTIASIAQDLVEESNFAERYKEVIEAEYTDIVHEIEQGLKPIPVKKVLLDFWKTEPSPELVLIPDLFGVYEGYASQRNGRFYSITGAANKKGKVFFDIDQIVWNSIHEFSHTFFQKLLYKDDEVIEKNKELCSSLSKEVDRIVKKFDMKFYHNPLRYFEETFIRAAQIHLNSNAYTLLKREGNYSNDPEMHIKRLEGEGFVYIKVFYDGVTEDDDSLESYLGVLDDLGN